MKKSIAIIASVVLVGATLSAAAGDEEPEHKPLPVVASEDRESYTSRSDERTSLSALVEAQADAQSIAAAEEEIEKRERVAAQAAAAEAARQKESAERAEKARQQKQEEQKKRAATPEPTRKTAPSGNIKQYAAGLVGAGQFGCLEALWNRESGWNHLAQNPSSGAYGIPQSLPGSKMASAGSDWRTNPYTQVRWGVTYIKSRYGTPCSAWAHSQSVGWY